MLGLEAAATRSLPSLNLSTFAFLLLHAHTFFDSPYIPGLPSLETEY